MPTGPQGLVYSSISHYLKAVASAGTADTQPVLEKMRSMPVNDVFAKGGCVREDMRLTLDLYLARVKRPAQSEEPWDYYEIPETIPAEQAFAPLKESLCPLVRK